MKGQNICCFRPPPNLLKYVNFIPTPQKDQKIQIHLTYPQSDKITPKGKKTHSYEACSQIH